MYQLTLVQRRCSAGLCEPKPFHGGVSQAYQPYTASLPGDFGREMAVIEIEPLKPIPGAGNVTPGPCAAGPKGIVKAEV